MPPSRFTPVIVGVGDVVNRSKDVNHAIEPSELMVTAICNAFDDTGISASARDALENTIDSIDVVRTWTWPYPDLPGLLAERLRIKPARRFYSDHGGNQPAKLVDEAARRISLGETKAAVVTGGEALASLTACAAAKQLPPRNWTKTKEDVTSVFSPTTRELNLDLGSNHGIGNPIQIYPLYENSFPAHRGQSPRDAYAESAEMYAQFAQVAERNEYAWAYGKPAETKDSIAEVSKRNRMICWPYPLLMNAFNTVNLAAAVVLTSTEHARTLGIPEEKWIYPLAGAGTQDSDNFWERPNYHTSPSISRSLDAGMQAADVKQEDIDLYDFYSCFPIVPKLACAHLNLPAVNPPKPITVLGGLTSFGGAGNNYSMHALTALTRALRPPSATTPAPHTALLLANGGVLTYQHVLILSSLPPKQTHPYPSHPPLPARLPAPDAPKIQERVPVGPTSARRAVLETFTATFDRAGKAERGYVLARLVPGGDAGAGGSGVEMVRRAERERWTRVLANCADEGTLGALCGLEAEGVVGLEGWVWGVEGEGRSVFAFERGEAEKGVRGKL